MNVTSFDKKIQQKISKMFYKKIFFVLDVLLKINIFKSILLYKI